VGDGDRVLRAAGGSVLHPRETDREVTALDGLIDRRPLDLNEASLPAEPAADQIRHLDVEAADLRGVGGVGLHERGASFGIAAQRSPSVVPSPCTAGPPRRPPAARTPATPGW